MKPFYALLALALSSVPAAAHPGSHTELTGLENALAHIAGSPFHVLLVLAAIGTVFSAGVLLRRRRQKSS